MSTERTNADVARAFNLLADFLEMAGENPYKSRAYRNAAATLNALREPVAKIAAENRLQTLAGFGDAIQAKTKDILATGTTSAIEKMRQQIPEGALELLKLPGLGPKTLTQLYSALHVDSVNALEEAVTEGKIRDISGMGPKMEEKVLDSIARYRKYAGSMLISEGLAAAVNLTAQVRRIDGVDKADYAGSVRRGTESVGDVNLTAATDSPCAVLEAFSAMASVDNVVERDAASIRVVLSGGVTADLFVAPSDSYGALVAWRTGSAEHNRQLAALAASKGLDFTDGTLYRNGERMPTPAEDDVYQLLGIPSIPACLREGRGEVEAAIERRLPKLVELSDIRGNLHTHTTESDGVLTLPQMAEAARSIGYEYLAITDHSQMVAIANGLTADRVRCQIRAVRDAEQSAGIRLLTGIECDVKQDGTMDLPDDVLAELDFVIASVHFRFRMTGDEITRRALRAIRNPHVDMMAHPTGRLINSREPNGLDIAQLIEACAQTDTALEINASPERLDLNETYSREARDAGVKIFVNSDAHSRRDLDFMQFGVDIARRAWLTADDVWNTRDYSTIEPWLKRDR